MFFYVVANLRNRGDNKPRTVGKLSNTINSLYQNKLSKQVRSSLIVQLEERGVISIDGAQITYNEERLTACCKRQGTATANPASRA
jgi:hypothetical protein